MKEPKDAEYVVYRTGYPNPNPPMEYLEQRMWDKYAEETPKTLCVEVSRGHTLADAKRLTKLYNDQRNMEEIK